VGVSFRRIHGKRKNPSPRGNPILRQFPERNNLPWYSVTPFQKDAGDCLTLGRRKVNTGITADSAKLLHDLSCDSLNKAARRRLWCILRHNGMSQNAATEFIASVRLGHWTEVTVPE
jgi:hypothetical protein